MNVHHEPDASKVDENRWKEIVVEEGASILLHDLECLNSKTPDEATLLNLEMHVQTVLREIGGHIGERLVERGVANFAAGVRERGAGR